MEFSDVSIREHLIIITAMGVTFEQIEHDLVGVLTYVYNVVDVQQF